MWYAILPVSTLDGVRGHPALERLYGVYNSHQQCVADAGALFGNSPQTSEWQMSHGAGGGIDHVQTWVDDANQLWAKASSIVLASS